MEIPVAKNFDDYVAVIAANSPHILVMDLWRRLDLTLRDYGDTLKPMIDSQNREAIISRPRTRPHTRDRHSA